MPFNAAYTVVALSNLAYVLLAYWLARKHFSEFAWILLVVAAVSTYFHLEPDNYWAFYFDCAVATLSTLLITSKLLPYVLPSPLFVFTVALLVTSTLLWLESGTERESNKYIFMHSAWHVLSALGMFLLVQCTTPTIKTGLDLGRVPLPLLAGNKV